MSLPSQNSRSRPSRIPLIWGHPQTTHGSGILPPQKWEFIPKILIFTEAVYPPLPQIFQNSKNSFAPEKKKKKKPFWAILAQKQRGSGVYFCPWNQVKMTLPQTEAPQIQK